MSLSHFPRTAIPGGLVILLTLTKGERPITICTCCTGLRIDSNIFFQGGKCMDIVPGFHQVHTDNDVDTAPGIPFSF